MLESEGIVGKGLLYRESVVELLKFKREKGNLFADFPIGATIQDGGKRKKGDQPVIVVTFIYDIILLLLIQVLNKKNKK